MAESEFSSELYRLQCERVCRPMREFIEKTDPIPELVRRPHGEKGEHIHEKFSYFGNLNGRAAMPVVGAGAGADRSRRPRRDGEHSRRLAAAGNSDPAPAGH